jgi:hypothetical protein
MNIFKIMKFIPVLLLIFIMAQQETSISQYAISLEPTPVFNSPDFPFAFGGSDGKTLKLDKEDLFRELEYIALKGSIFSVIDSIDKGNFKIYKVTAYGYDYDSVLYIDNRFVSLTDALPSVQEKKLPPKKEIIKFLDKAVGSRYIWGGNYIFGIDKLLKYYPPSEKITDDEKCIWTFKGCDCSGLMYEATNGYTERNTSKLIYYGEPVQIEGLAADEIKAKLKPLDMIVWKGHVIYVYDENTAIQSALSKGGVVKTDLLETINHLLKTRTAVNNYDNSGGERFVVRRWYTE